MKIANIKASLHRHEIDLPGIGQSIETRIFVFVEVETDDGLKGLGCTGSFLPWAVMACIEHHLFPLLKGKDVRHTEAIHYLVWRKLNNRTYTGVISNALSAIDIACGIIRGKTRTCRSRNCSAASARAPRPTRRSAIRSSTSSRSPNTRKKFLADGHTMLKMVVGGEPTRTWKDDVRRVRAAREAIGPDVDLMIDANCWFNPHDALMLAKGVEDCNLNGSRSRSSRTTPARSPTCATASSCRSPPVRWKAIAGASASSSLTMPST